LRLFVSGKCYAVLTVHRASSYTPYFDQQNALTKIE